MDRHQLNHQANVYIAYALARSSQSVFSKSNSVSCGAYTRNMHACAFVAPSIPATDPSNDWPLYWEPVRSTFAHAFLVVLFGPVFFVGAWIALLPRNYRPYNLTRLDMC